jgi:hypothetical protein
MEPHQGMRSMTKIRRQISAGVAIATLLTVLATLVTRPASAQQIQLYRGPVKLPDFNGRDKAFAMYKTRIINEMRTGPNFAGTLAMIEIGCGAGCRFVYAADVSSGRVYLFPYGGEDFYMMDLRYGIKSRQVEARWTSGDDCMADSLTWNGREFASQGKTRVGPSDIC